MPRERDDDDRYEDGDRPRRSRRRYDDDDDRPPPKKGMSTGVILLIVFGVLALVALPLVAIMIGLLLPAVQKVREAAGRQQVSNNGKQLALALHNFDSQYNHIHGPFVDEESGLPFNPPANPSDRLSWRVAILPYVEYDGIFRQFKMREPWNSPANLPHASIPIRPYLDPADPTSPPQTRYRCFYDNGALFDSDRSARGPLSRVRDGLSNTLMYVESTELVGWTQFNDFRYTPGGALPQMGHPSRNTFMAMMADGSVRWVSKGVSPQTLNAAITKNGGEVLGPDW